MYDMTLCFVKFMHPMEYDFSNRIMIFRSESLVMKLALLYSMIIRALIMGSKGLSNHTTQVQPYH